MQKIKIIDVANYAGVSKSTVSQFLNGRLNYMSEKTRLKIQDAIQALNYVPNPIARSLKTDRTNTIGVIVRDITGSDTSRVLRGIDDYCKAQQFNVLIHNTDFNPEAEASALQNLRQMKVDGIIIASSGQNTDTINKYINAGLPVVQFQMEYQPCDHNIVLSDYHQGAFKATEYLVKLGHKRICFISQNFSHVVSRQARYQGYLDALKKHNIDYDPALLQYWDRKSKLHTPLKEMLETTKATAIFAQHFAITEQVMSELKQLKLEIGKDISLISFDDIPMVDHFKVPITVVKQDPYRVGEESGRILIENIRNKGQAEQRVTIPCELLERASCIPV